MNEKLGAPVYGLPLTSEQEVRRRLVEKLLDNGTKTRHVEVAADDLVRYVLEGKKPDPQIVKKTEISLPPGNEHVEANAYLLDDNTIQIELKDPERLAVLFSNLDIYGVSFYPVDTPKDN